MQLHRGATQSSKGIIFPGDPEYFERFDVKEGLEKLRALITNLQDKGHGIILVGDVGVTSHFGDVLRKAKIPSKVEAPSEKVSV